MQSTNTNISDGYFVMTLSIEVLLRKKVYNFDNPLTLKTSKEDLLLGLLCYIGTST